MDGLRLHSVEHPSFFVKNGKDFFCLWMVSGNDNGNILFCSWLFSFYLYCLEIITFLLTSFVEPVREKSCTLRLLLASSTAHIKQDIRIYSEKFVNDAKHSLHYLNVIRRCNMVKVGEIKPICLKKRMLFHFKVDSISASFVCFKIKNLISVPYFVWRKNIDKGNFKSFHDLGWFQIVNMLFLSFCFHAQLFFVHSSDLFLTSSDSSFCTIEPRPDFLRRSLRISRCLCLHNDCLFTNFGCKFNILF